MQSNSKTGALDSKWFGAVIVINVVQIPVQWGPQSWSGPSGAIAIQLMIVTDKSTLETVSSLSLGYT